MDEPVVNPSETFGKPVMETMFGIETESLSNKVLSATPPNMSARSGESWIAALSDNGASLKAGCAKTLDGAVIGTLRKQDAGGLGVGDESMKLECMGSYLYVHKRYDM